MSTLSIPCDISIHPTLYKGEIAKYAVILRAYQKRFVVSLPTSDCVRYDLILDNGYNLIRAQVKQANFDYIASEKNDNNKKYKKRYCIKLCSHGKLYTKNDIDLLLVYIPETNQIVYFLPNEFHNKYKLGINLSDPSSLNYVTKRLW